MVSMSQPTTSLPTEHPVFAQLAERQRQTAALNAAAALLVVPSVTTEATTTARCYPQTNGTFKVTTTCGRQVAHHEKLTAAQAADAMGNPTAYHAAAWAASLATRRAR